MNNLNYKLSYIYDKTLWNKLTIYKIIQYSLLSLLLYKPIV
jgi:hypothetical protein